MISSQYRRIKPAAGLVMGGVALLLMNGNPDTSARWYFGMGIAIVMIVAYLAEEIVWMVRNQGRPCAKCGKLLHVRAFRLHSRCSECGEAQ
jgi:hypothetical protein